VTIRKYRINTVACLVLAGGLVVSAPAQRNNRVGILVPGTPDLTIEQLVDRGRIEEARERLRERMSAEGKTARTLLIRATISYREGLYETALKDLRESFALDENVPDVHKLMGLCLTKLEKPKLAEPFFQIAVKLAPDDFMAHFYLGLHYYTTNRFEQAEREFNTVIKLRPTHLDGYSYLGLALEEMERREEAINAYRRGTEVADTGQSKDETPYFYLGRYLIRLQRSEQSLPWLRRAVEVNPEALEALNLLGKTLADTGRNEEALPYLAKGAEIDPRDPSPHYVMMRVYTKLGRRDEARQARAKFRELEALKAAEE
jgi:tetratricopeptide (TPR) repeat protein